MNNLKTLKDIEDGVNLCDDYCSATLNLDRLKQEAIKWIKEFEKEGREYDSRIEVFKHFFNITEEDLK